MAGITDDIAHLSQEIGPRPAGTEEEQQAALYIADEFKKGAGFNAVIEDFNCIPNPNLPKLILFGIIFVAVLVGMLVPVAGVVTFIISALAAVLLVLEVINKPLLSRYLRLGVSQNIVAKYVPPAAGRNNSRRKIVLVANYDSGKVDRIPKIGFIENNRALMKRISLICAVAAPVLLLLKTVFVGADANAAAVVFNVLIVLSLIGILPPLVRTVVDRFAAYNQAANNNASGTAVLLDVARQVGSGLVSTKELEERAAREGAEVLGEDAAREAGAVPEGAQVRYETGRSMSPEESLAAAKAAIAALTGQPVADKVPLTDISGKLVQGDGYNLATASQDVSVHFTDEEPSLDFDPELYSDANYNPEADLEDVAEEPAAQAEEEAAGVPAAAVGAVAGGVAAAAGAGFAAAAGAAEAGQEVAEEVEEAAESFVRETPEALQAGLTGMNTLVDNTPSWAVTARQKAHANNPELAAAKPSVSRSRFADTPAARIQAGEPVLSTPYLSLSGRQPMTYITPAPAEEATAGVASGLGYQTLDQREAAARAKAGVAEEPAAAEVAEDEAIEVAEGAEAQTVETAAEPAPYVPEVPQTELQMRLASLREEISKVEAPTVSEEVKAAFDEMERQPEPVAEVEPEPVFNAEPELVAEAEAEPEAESFTIPFTGPNPLLQPYVPAGERAEEEPAVEPVVEEETAEEPVAEEVEQVEAAEAEEFAEEEAGYAEADVEAEAEEEAEAEAEAEQAPYDSYPSEYGEYDDEYDVFADYENLEVVEGVVVEPEEAPERTRPARFTFGRKAERAEDEPVFEEFEQEELVFEEEEPAEAEFDEAVSAEDTGVLSPEAVEAAAAQAEEELEEELAEEEAEEPAEEVTEEVTEEAEGFAEEEISDEEEADEDAELERYEEEYEDYDYYQSPSMRRRPRSEGRTDAAPSRPGTWVTRAQEGTRSVGQAFSRLKERSLEKLEDVRASFSAEDELEHFEEVAEEAFEEMAEAQEAVAEAEYEGVEALAEAAKGDYPEAPVILGEASESEEDEEVLEEELVEEEIFEEEITEEEIVDEEEPAEEPEEEPEEEMASMVLPEAATRTHRSRIRLTSRKPRFTEPTVSAEHTAAIAPIDVSEFSEDEEEAERTGTAEFIAVGAMGEEPEERETTGDEDTGRVPMVEVRKADEEAAEFYEAQRDALDERHRSNEPASPIVGMEDIPAVPKINVADPMVTAESQRAARVIKLPDLSVSDATGEGAKVRTIAPAAAPEPQAHPAPEPQAEEAVNPLLSNMIPRIDSTLESPEPAAAQPIHLESSQLPAIEPLQAAEPVQPELDFEAEDQAEEPAAAAPAPAAKPNTEYYEVPKSRMGGFFSRFGRNKKEEQSVREWVNVDDDWNAQDVGRERGSWESFRQEDAPEADADGLPVVDVDADVTEAADAAASSAPEGSFIEPDGSAGTFTDVNYSNTDFGDSNRPWNGGALSLKGLRERMPKIGNREEDEFVEEDEAVSTRETPQAKRRDRQESDMEQFNRDIEALNEFRHPEINTEVWFVALGAELSYNSGMRAFMEEHADELQGAIIVDINALGAGDLCYIEEEGEYIKRRPSSRMKRFLRGATERSGVNFDIASLAGHNTTASVAMGRGYQAMTLAGLDGDQIALKGSAEDVLENLDPELLKRNSSFIMALLKSI